MNLLVEVYRFAVAMIAAAVIMAVAFGALYAVTTYLNDTAQSLVLLMLIAWFIGGTAGRIYNFMGWRER